MSTKTNGAGSGEIILAEEQSVVLKSRAESDRVVQGTLVLTNKRLIFAAADVEEDVSEVGIAGIPRTDRLRFADIEDLSNVSRDPSNLSIPLTQIESVTGHDGLLRRPGIKVKWRDGANERSAEFSADLYGGRKKTLKDWAAVIEGLKSRRINVQLPSAQPPARDSLPWRIMQVLGDMQEKGVLGIEEQVESSFKVELDPDEVDEACQDLAEQGFLDRISDPSGDNFYRKRSPLGEDDLSS